MKSPKEMSKMIRMKKSGYGHRVLDNRPGQDEGPILSDLQDSEIERQDETTDALDENSPMHTSEHEGQDLSNATESSEEERTQKTSNGSMEGREEADRELLRNARKERIRSKMRA